MYLTLMIVELPVHTRERTISHVTLLLEMPYKKIHMRVPETGGARGRLLRYKVGLTMVQNDKPKLDMNRTSNSVSCIINEYWLVTCLKDGKSQEEGGWNSWTTLSKIEEVNSVSRIQTCMLSCYT